MSYTLHAANTFKFCDNRYPLYIKDIFNKSYCHISQASTRNSTKKLSQPLRRTSYGQNCIPFLVPSVWNNLVKTLVKLITKFVKTLH